MEFRKLARYKQALTEGECIALLKEEKRGVFSVTGDEGYPYGMPLNHYYNEEDGKIYFHSGKTGHKVDALKSCDKASFCVYDSGSREAGGWALNFKCVIVFGRVEFIEDREKISEIARALSHKFTDDEAYIQRELEQSGPGTLLFALVPEYMTGKTVNEK